MAETVVVWAEPLKAFAARAMEELGVPAQDALIVADNLVAADLRGIPSHGVARLRRYVKGIQDGIMKARPVVKTVVETPSTATIDAGGGLGQPVSSRAMKKAIEKALAVGSGFVAVRNSNHYGIAGYYAMMALEHDCIGISMTNADVLVVPTFARNAMLGTNPIAVAAPATREPAFVLDMATSTVPRGKLEVYRRQGKQMPMGWATDETGDPTEDAGRVLDNFTSRRGGGLLPLGGAGELMSGYKGYGLALLVDVMCALLSGAAYANRVYPRNAEGKPLPADLGHFFGAWRIDAFRPPEEFKAEMDSLQRLMRQTPRAEAAKVQGHDAIYIPGEKEHQRVVEQTARGIQLEAKVADDLKAIAKELGIEYGV
jgi:L-2-hydroxycarboxylate dehydrogenase (NAD+)